MLLARTTKDLAPVLAGALVPTMGALHEGHLALIRLARRWADARPAPSAVVVSVFVNPTQFDRADDLERYPRDLRRDADLAREAGADGVFAPTAEVVYPPGETIPVEPIPVCAHDRGLEDLYRPGHFEGVCQVVRRLFKLCQPTAAVFGEKDWQQLQTARAMSRCEALGVEILAGPTVREPDGLALSSRNAHLTPDERPRAVALSASLARAAAEPTVADAERAMRQTMSAAGIEVNYASVRDAETLAPLAPSTRADDLPRPARALVAGRLGFVRLLDNAPWPVGS